MTIVNLSTYPPKQCGIASFSKDLRDNLELSGWKVRIAAMSDRDTSYHYPAEVGYQIRVDHPEDYRITASKINYADDINICIIQHEYGIFGGPDGEYVLSFTDNLDKPFILVTHTVLPEPSHNQMRVLKKLAEQAVAVVCMTRRSARLLDHVFAVPINKIYLIHHGTPVFSNQDRETLKTLYGLKGRQIITTFGLIGPGKGLENGIRALAQLVDKHPDILYLIAGETHPVLKKREGESYREMLQELTSSLGMEDHVTFVNQYLPLDQLGDYLNMSDIYLSPYPNPDQAVSGTLAYALGCGLAIVATPYQYALEMLQTGRRGLIALSPAPLHLAQSLDQVLSRPRLQAILEQRAYKLGQKMQWPFVGQQYGLLAESLLKKPLRGNARERILR
ncbi:MAG TPA: glycosyltransferase family 4 protein [Syntrophomonadaceae bacterium]|nr:glycosyltransferase family 4 protein [Syntrophomonadaceae bacterium]